MRRIFQKQCIEQNHLICGGFEVIGMSAYLWEGSTAAYKRYIALLEHDI